MSWVNSFCSSSVGEGISSFCSSGVVSEGTVSCPFSSSCYSMAGGFSQAAQAGVKPKNIAITNNSTKILNLFIITLSLISLFMGSN